MSLRNITATSNSVLMSKLVKELVGSGKTRGQAISDAIIEMKKRGIKFKTYKDHIIAKEGILPYKNDGETYRALKRWVDLKRWIGKTTLVTDDHPLTDGITDTTPLFGKAQVKQCPIGANLLCAEVTLLEDAPIRSGYSVGFGADLNWTPGEFGADNYDFIQELDDDLDHLAMTDHSRDRNALVPIIGDTLQSPLQAIMKVNNSAMIFDSYNTCLNKEINNIEDKYMPKTIEELLAEIVKIKDDHKNEIANKDKIVDGLTNELKVIEDAKIAKQKKLIEDAVNYLKDKWEFTDADIEGYTPQFLLGVKHGIEIVTTQTKNSAEVINTDSTKKKKNLDVNNMIFKDGKLVYNTGDGE